ncbi:MAG: hypothetical protein Q7R52_02845 [archaeon]|nr:hypothetical protein [archaeon]
MGNILTISSKFHPGVTSVFTNMCSVIDNCEHEYFEDSKKDVNEYLLVVLGAWVDGYEELIEKIKVKKAILWTSSILQSEMTPDRVELKIFLKIQKLLADGKIDFILVGDKKLFMATDDERICLFPYPIRKEIFKTVNKKKFNDDEINVGLFTVSDPRKNTANQIIAVEKAIQQNSKIRFHSNVTNYGNVNENFVSYPWMKKGEYDEVIEKIHVGLNVFVCESFCYSFVELMSLGIPTICSKTVADNFDLSGRLRFYLEVLDCDNWREIYQKIKRFETYYDGMDELSVECQDFMKIFAEENNNKLKNLVEFYLT